MDKGLNLMLNNVTRRNFLKGMAAVGAASVAATGLTACGGGGGAQGGKIFRFAQADSKLPLDPQRTTSSNGTNISDAVLEGLLYWNDDLELVPVLAEEMPEWSEDGLSLPVKIKKGVKFHDGSELTANDVKYTFTRMFTPETGCLNTYMYDYLVGAKDMLAGKTKELKGVEVVDDYNVVFHLEKPFSQFKENLGIAYASIFPQKACEEAGTDWGIGGRLVGSGPYKMVSDDGSTVVLEANTEWHGGTPNLDGVEVKYIDDNNTKLMMYENGEVDACDLAGELLDQYKDDEKYSKQIHYFDTLGTYFIVMNLKRKEFQDVRVRKALSLAIDRKTFIKELLSGTAEPCTCFLAPEIPGSYDDEGEFPYDPEEAKRLLKEAGAEGLSFQIQTKADTTTKQMTAIQAYWKEIGVNCEIVQSDPAVYSEDQGNGNLTCFLQNWFPLYPDADNNMYSYFVSQNAAMKSSFFNNAKFDKLMNDARSEADVDKRAELYKQADHILTWEEYACLPVFWPKKMFIAQDNVEMKCANLVYHFNDVKMS